MAMPNMDKERKHRPPFPEPPESPTPWKKKSVIKGDIKNNIETLEG